MLIAIVIFTLMILWGNCSYAEDRLSPITKTNLKKDQMIKLGLSKGTLKDYYPDLKLLIDSPYWNSAFAPHNLIVNMEEHYVNFVSSRIKAGTNDASEMAKKRCGANNHKYYGVSHFSVSTLNTGRGILVKWSGDIICAD